MTYKYEAEYTDQFGEYQYIDVDLIVDWYWESDDYDDEYGHVDRGGYYMIIEGYPEWDKKLYTFEENWIIAISLIKDWYWLEDRIINELEEQSWK